MKIISTSKALLFCALIVFLSSCQKNISEKVYNNASQSSELQAVSLSDSDNYIATSWINFELLRLVKGAKTSAAPITARAIGYSGITMYEIVRNGNPSHASLVGQLSGLTSLPKPTPGQTYRWSVACNAGTAHLLRYLFTNRSSTVDLSLDSLEAANNALLGNTTSDDFIRSVAYGVNLADSIIAWSKNDGGDNAFNRLFPTDYVLPIGPQYYVATSPNFPRPLLPYWGSNYPFINGIVKRTQPAEGPLPFSTDTASDYYKSVLDVYNTVNNLTDEQKTIAGFWDDNVSSIHPSGHSENILTQMLVNTNASLFTAARAYALMGIAENDIFISCWKTKYNYVAVRPQTYIQTNINPTWVSYIATPPHPEYTAGHATESAAASIILNNLFGAHTPFTDHTHDIDGYAPRSFANFGAFAQEAALSRVYGGIHYRRTCQLGYAQGKKLANIVLSKLQL